jgi:hypothetical protein
MNSKIFVFAVVAALLTGCGDKGSDKSSNNDEAFAGQLDNLNPYEVPRNAMSQYDADLLWQRARDVEAVVPSENTYLSQTASYGELNRVSERERRQASRKLNFQGSQFLDSITRNCEINDFDSSRNSNTLESSVSGRNCPMESSYRSETRHDGGLQQTNVVTNFSAGRSMAQASGMQYIRTQNSYTLEQSFNGGGGRRHHQQQSSPRMYGKGQIDVQYTDGERVVGSARYDINENTGTLKMLFELQSRRGVLRVVVIRSRGTSQAFVNGREANVYRVLQGFVPARSDSGRDN